MNFKKFIKIFLLSLIILSFSVISAQDDPLEEFLRDNVTQITVTVTQDASWVDFYLDTSGTSFDEQNINIQNKTIGNTHIYRIAFSFKISEVLGDLNWKVKIERDSRAPEFDELNIMNQGLIEGINISIDNKTITGNLYTKNFLQEILNTFSSDLNISDINSINNYLEQHPLSVASDRHIIFTKEGVNYRLWNDEGYGDISDEWKTKIIERINKGVKAINIQDIFNRSIAPFLEENDINFSNLDMNYIVYVDPLAIQLKDGTYAVPVTVSHGNINYTTKNITLILEGISDEEISAEGDESKEERDDYRFRGRGAVTGESPTPISPPIEVTPTPTPGFFATITGAIIGALGTGGLIVVIAFIVSVVGLMVMLRIKRKVEGGKGGKLNEKGDQDEK